MCLFDFNLVKGELGPGFHRGAVMNFAMIVRPATRISAASLSMQVVINKELVAMNTS